MKKLFLFISISLVSVSTFGQNIPLQITKSELFKDEFKDTKIVLSEEDGNGGIIIVRSYKGHGISPKGGIYFEHYDSNLKLLNDYDLEVRYPIYQKQKTFLGYFFKDNEIHIVNICNDIKEKAYICTATTINSNDFTTKEKELFRLTREEAKKIGSFSLPATYEKQDLKIPTEKSSGVTMNLNKDKGTFSISLDMNADDSEVFKLYLFDNKMNKKFETVFERKIKDSRFEFQNVEVSNDGNSLFLLGKVFTDEKKKSDEGGKYQFELTKVNKDSQRNQSIDIAEHYSNSLKTIVLNEKLVLTGLYSDRKDNRFKGITYFELDPENLNIKNTKFNPFTEQFLKDKYGDDKPKELKNLILKGISISENEDITFTAEEFYTVTTGNGGGGIGGGVGIGGGGQTFYHFDDIVSIKMNKNGLIPWSRNINKRQASEFDDTSFISNTSITKNDDTYFFINSGEKVKNLDNGRIEFTDTRKSKYDLNIVRIDQTGNLDYQKVLDDEENEVPFMVSDGIVSKNSVFFLGQNGKTKQLLKVTL